MGPLCMANFFHIELISELDNLFEFSDFEHCSREPSHEHIFALDHDPGDETRLVKKFPLLPSYYSIRAR